MSGQIINVEGTSIEIWDYNAESKSLSNKRTTTAPNTIASDPANIISLYQGWGHLLT